MRTYPAYARTIARHLMRGNHPACVAVLLSARWWYFDRAAKVCIKPDEWAMGRFEFGYLKGQHVVAVLGEEVELAQFGELLCELMAAGPRLLWAVHADGTWIYKDSSPDVLRGYVSDLTKRAIDACILDRALDRYQAAQVAELEWTIREVQRALEVGRAGVPFVAQRQQSLDITSTIFSDPHATVDERAA